ncbi:divergent polysaccharide deacetylase family protein [Emcibacter nanhaiensis]|uniref:Divergent polysaccharide deacetylase family protein n=2 Tax=Emcibacter nanhaiensis TaxID=1505037 RepID=A0A501PMW3_9PROT|nr:divergent polysaccharide deacetylase family protein [Emcibacter nanhaiensis]
MPDSGGNRNKVNVKGKAGNGREKMAGEPELPTMTRRRTISPLVAAWVLVLVCFGGLFLWLSLTADEPDKQKVAEQRDEAAPDKKAASESIIVLSDPEDSLSFADQETTSEEEPQEQAADAGAEPEPEPDRAEEQIPYTKFIRLKEVPNPGLVVEGKDGPLPVLGPDGLVAWQEYARPHEDLSIAPRIAIVVKAVGMNAEYSERAIKELPGEMDIAITPYGRNLQDWVDMGREYGHEALLLVPMEPLNYPENDPGPHTLMAGYSARDNMNRLMWVLSRITGYVGVLNEMGSKFTASENAVHPVLEELHRRGLMFVDSRSSRYSVAAKYARRIGMPRALNNRYIDNVVSEEEIQTRLKELESTAKTYGAALGIARAFPLTIEQLDAWARTLPAKGIQLVPVTAIANRQPIR